MVLDKHLLDLGVGTTVSIRVLGSLERDKAEQRIHRLQRDCAEGLSPGLGTDKDYAGRCTRTAMTLGSRRNPRITAYESPPVPSASTWPRLPCCGMDTPSIMESVVPSIMESVASLMESLASFSATHLERKVLEHVREARLGLEPAASLYDD
jgi:hypothetical protein